MFPRSETVQEKAHGKLQFILIVEVESGGVL
jgi:hypothetical protein